MQPGLRPHYTCGVPCDASRRSALCVGGFAYHNNSLEVSLWRGRLARLVYLVFLLTQRLPQTGFTSTLVHEGAEDHQATFPKLGCKSVARSTRPRPIMRYAFRQRAHRLNPCAVTKRLQSVGWSARPSGAGPTAPSVRHRARRDPHRSPGSSSAFCTVPTFMPPNRTKLPGSSPPANLK